MAMESPDCAARDPPVNSEYEESNESVLIELVEFFRDAIGDKLSEEKYRYTAPDKVGRNYWIYIVEVSLGVDKNIASVQPCHVDDNEPESPEEELISKASPYADENESERANRQAEELLREEEEARNASQQKISSSKALKKKRKKQKAKQGKEGKTDEGGVDEEEKDEGYVGEKDNVNEEERVIGYEGEGDGDHEAERVNNEEEEKDERNEGQKVNVNEEERAIRYEGKRVNVHEKLAVQYEGGKVNGYKGEKVNGYKGDDGHKHFYRKVGRKQYKEKESCSADGRQKDPKEEDEHSLPEFTADEESVYLSHKAEENEQIAFVGDGRDIYSNENTMPGENVDGVEKPKELRQSEENTVPGENVNLGQHIETNEKSEEPKQATEGIFSKENVFVAQYKQTVRQINEPEQAPGNTISREKVKQTQEPKQARNVDMVQGKRRVEKSKKLKQQARNVNFNEVRDAERVEESERLKQQKEVPNQATVGIFYDGNTSEAQDTEFVKIIESEQAPENIISRERVPETLEIESVKQIQQPKQDRNVDEVIDKKRVKKSKRLNQQTKELNQATESIFSKGNASEAQDPEIVRQTEEPKQDPENIISTERVPEALETEPKQAKNLDEVQDKSKSKSQKEPRASTTSVPMGIRNLGSTCYMNAAFQFLLRPMGHKWLDLYKRGAPDTDLSKEFHQLWDLLLSNNGGSTIESESTKCIQSAWNRFKHPNNGGSTFQPTQQEDAEEFMTFIFTHLLNGLLCANAFLVKYSKVSRCRICPNTEVIHNHQYPSLRLGFRDNGRGAFDLTEFLANKFQNSVCSEYFCGRCGGNYMGNYNRFIFTSEFLIICLPRTTKLKEVGNWKRQYKFQNIQHDLDLKPYFTHGINVPEERTRYKLRAVLTHIGQSMDSGHYIAAVLDTTSGTWFKFDDDRVTKLVDFQRQVGDDAYMLLYRNLAREK